MADQRWTETGPRPLWQRGVDLAIPGSTRDYRSLFGGNRTAAERAIAAARIASSATGVGGMLAKLGIKLADKYVQSMPSTIWRQLTESDKAILKDYGVTDADSLTEYLNSYNPDALGTVTNNSSGLGLNMPGQNFGLNSPIMPQMDRGPAMNPTVSVGDIQQYSPAPVVAPQVQQPTASNPYSYYGDEVNSGPPVPNISGPRGSGGTFSTGSGVGGFGTGSAATITNAGQWRGYGGNGGVPQGLNNLEVPMGYWAR